MFGAGTTIAIVGLVIAGASALVWKLMNRAKSHRANSELEQARRTFHQQREWLEARFVTLASRSGKPRGLAWVDCDFDDGVSFARDRTSQRLRALVGVTIRFRAVDGGGMEDNPNVGNLRAATAIFHRDEDEWQTDGRTLFNLNPAEAILHFQHELETVE